MSIAKKLLLITLLVTGLSVVITIVLTWSAATDALHGLEGKRVLDSVEREASILQSTIDMVKSDLSMLADGGARYMMEENTEPSVDGFQKVADQLDIMMRERHAYRQVKMLLDSGTGSHRVLVSLRNDNVVHTMVDQPTANWNFESLLAEKQGLRNFNEQTRNLSDETSGERVFFVSIPVRGKDRNVIGAIAVVVAIDQVFRTLGKAHDGIAYWIADSDGQYLYQSRPETSGSHTQKAANAIRDFQLAQTWDQVLSGAKPQLIMEFPAIATMLGIRRATLNVGEGNEIENVLVVGGVISLVELEIKAAALQRQLAIAVASIGLLMLLTLSVSTSRLLRPIDVLIKAANRIASGDQNIVIPANNNDEIGTLSRAMTRMAEKLRLAGKNSEESAMGQMASMIAHDLRNALSSVKMNLQILDEHHRKEGDMQIENCEIALRQVRYMETILNDMLTYARPGTAEFDWVDLGDTLRAASVSLLPEITGKSVEVRMEGEEKLPTIMADRNKLLQLFQNVLGNAIYAVPEWGLITIRTRCLLHESQPSVEIRFEDDGPGISPQIADKVFDPFFTTNARGTGLGLAIVQRIVAQHRGRVYLDSERGHGTTVVVVLPLTQEGTDDSPQSGELS